MKRREMQWDVRATGVQQLAAQRFYFFGIIIFTRNQKRRQFHPARCLLHQIGYCFQNRLNLGSGKLFIKALGKSLEINICSIHRAKKLFARRITNIACGNRNILDVLRTTSGGKIEGIFQKNNGRETQLPFISRHFKGAQILPLVIAHTTPQAVAALIDHIVSKVQEKLLFVLSSDLSHFQNQDMAQKLDAQAARLIETGQVIGLGPGLACGHLAIAGFLASTAGQGTRVLGLAMADSFAVTQDAKRVVGYGAWAFFRQIERFCRPYTAKRFCEWPVREPACF